jgi:hypothetical protein
MDMVIDTKLNVPKTILKEMEIDMVLYGVWRINFYLASIVETFCKAEIREALQSSQEGGAFCYLHSDGGNGEALPELREMEVDILNIQRGCNDRPRILKGFRIE